MSRHFDLEEIRDALSIPAYLAARGFSLRREGAGYRGGCPICAGSRRASKLSVSKDGRLCQCFGCGLRGDLFKLIMGLDGCGFFEALRSAAELAGVAPGVRPSFAEKLEREAVQHERALAEAAERSRTEWTNRERWNDLLTAHRDGERYLRSRAIEMPLPEKIARFGHDGKICVAIRSIDDSRIVNVACRAIRHGVRPKVRSWRGHTRGVFGNPAELKDSSGPIVLCEGVFDFLSGRQMYPPHSVVGSHGATRIPAIVQELADWVRFRGLWLAAHPDRAGRESVLAVIEVAKRNGIPLRKIEIIKLVDGDLNDHLRRHSDGR